jgi:tetratricopeptide (TPR) repeat protein
MAQERRHNIGAIRELLLAAFNAEELRGLFAFAMSRDLRLVVGEFAPEDGKTAMVRKAVAYCRSRFLMDELLSEVKEANPRTYARFEGRLYAGPARGASAPVLPLPVDLPDFEGRDAQIDRILTRLDQQGAVPLVAIHGPGGIGKTALAVHVAHRLVAEGRFGDVQLLVDLRGTDRAPADPAEALESLLNATGGPDPGRPRDLDSLAALWRKAIRGKDAILILDNVADAAQVRPLLSGWTSCAVLVTSREGFALPGAGGLDLEPLRPSEARALLQELAPRIDPGEVGTTIEACGRMPLALRIAGSHLCLDDGIAPEAYARMLAGERARLACLYDLDDPGLDVAAAIQLGATQLDRAQRRAWTLLALFPTSFDWTAAAALWGEVREGVSLRHAAWADDLWAELQEGEGFDPEEWDEGRVGALQQLLEMLAGPMDSRPSVEALDEDETRARLQVLCSRSLLSYDPKSSRYRQHEMVRLVAARGLETLEEGVVEMARLRLARHYEKAAGVAEEQYEQGGEGELQGQTLFELEWPHIRAGQAWAASRARAGGEAAWLCSDYPNAAAGLLSLRLHPRDWIAWLEAATRAARRLGDRQAEGNHLGRLGKAYEELGRAEEAIDFYLQALAVARKSGDRRSEGTWLADLGVIYHELGDTVRARDSWTQALSVLEAVEEPRAREVRRRLSGLED